MSKRKSYSSDFKTKVVLEVLKERETMQEIAKKYGLHAGGISSWKSQFLSKADVVFEKGSSQVEEDREKDALFKKVGQFRFDVDF